MLLDRYLVREVATTFVAVAMVLVAVFLAYSLTRFLTDATGGLLRPHEVLRLAMLKSLVALDVLLPLATYFGLVIALGRLNSTNELGAMRAAGLRGTRLARPLLIGALLVACAVTAISGSVRPWAYGAMYALRDAARASSELDRIKPRRFYLYESGDRAVYVDAIDRDSGMLRGVFVRTRSGDDIEVISAPSGRLRAFVTPHSHRLQLAEASIFRSIAGGTDFLGRFGALSLSLDAMREVDHEYRTKSESTAALLLSAEASDRAELQWRLSTPASTMLLAIAALALVDDRPRRGRYARLPLAIGIYAAYYNLLGVGRTWVEQEVLRSLWWAPGSFAAALLAYYLAIRIRNGIAR